jgi:hypothetical protein
VKMAAEYAAAQKVGAETVSDDAPTAKGEMIGREKSQESKAKAQVPEKILQRSDAKKSQQGKAQRERPDSGNKERERPESGNIAERERPEGNRAERAEGREGQQNRKEKRAAKAENYRKEQELKGGLKNDDTGRGLVNPQSPAPKFILKRADRAQTSDNRRQRIEQTLGESPEDEDDKVDPESDLVFETIEFPALGEVKQSKPSPQPLPKKPAAKPTPPQSRQNQKQRRQKQDISTQFFQEGREELEENLTVLDIDYRIDITASCANLKKT